MIQKTNNCEIKSPKRKAPYVKVLKHKYHIPCG